ncbi:hypothetical protein [Streptomyces sp. NPDC001966]
MPNAALKNTSLEAWVTAFLEQAQEELDDQRGELLLKVYTEPVPAASAMPGQYGSRTSWTDARQCG